MTIDLWTTETRTKFPGVWREARTSDFFGPYGLFVCLVQNTSRLDSLPLHRLPAPRSLRWTMSC